MHQSVRDQIDSGDRSNQDFHHGLLANTQDERRVFTATLEEGLASVSTECSKLPSDVVRHRFIECLACVQLTTSAEMRRASERPLPSAPAGRNSPNPLLVRREGESDFESLSKGRCVELDQGSFDSAIARRVVLVLRGHNMSFFIAEHFRDL